MSKSKIIQTIINGAGASRGREVPRCGDAVALSTSTVFKNFLAENPRGRKGSQWVADFVARQAPQSDRLVKIFLAVVDMETPLYTENPDDPPTKFGVTWPTWQDLCKNEKLTPVFSSKADFRDRFTIDDAFKAFLSFEKYAAPFSDPRAALAAFDFAFFYPASRQRFKDFMRSAGLSISTKDTWTPEDEATLANMDPYVQRMLCVALRLETISLHLGKSESKMRYYMGWTGRCLNDGYFGDEFPFELYQEFRFFLQEVIFNPNYMKNLSKHPKWVEAYFTGPTRLRGSNSLPLWPSKRGIGQMLTQAQWDAITVPRIIAGFQTPAV